jgi:hypothetical protein
LVAATNLAIGDFNQYNLFGSDVLVSLANMKVVFTTNVTLVASG